MAVARPPRAVMCSATDLRAMVSRAARRTAAPASAKASAVAAPIPLLAPAMRATRPCMGRPAPPGTGEVSAAYLGVAGMLMVQAPSGQAVQDGHRDGAVRVQVGLHIAVEGPLAELLGREARQAHVPARVVDEHVVAGAHR